MRCMFRNKQDVYYALYSGRVDAVDGAGNKSGEHIVTYANPVKISANVSASRGTAEQEMFGIGVNYTKTIMIDKVDCPIDEHTILWVDVKPDAQGESGTVKHDYVVEQVAQSLNSVAYAVRKVDVS